MRKNGLTGLRAKLGKDFQPIKRKRLGIHECPLKMYELAV